MSPRGHQALRCPHGSSTGRGGDERSGEELVRQVQARTSTLGWATGILGALVVFAAIGFLIPIFVGPAELAELAVLNGPIAAAYLIAVGTVVMHLFRRRITGTLEWLTEERVPDDSEHRRTLRLALYSVKLDAIAWVLGGVLLSGVNLIAHSWQLAAVVGATIWLGGEMTCALSYLASERTLRPITARALAARPTGASVAPGVRARLAMAWVLGTGVPLLGVVVVGAVGITESAVDGAYIGGAVLFLGATAYAAGLAATLFAAKAIAEPVTAVRRGLKRIESGELDAQVAVDDGSEVGLLQAGFNRMAEGLRERERIRDLFGRQVGEEVAHAALRDGVRLGGEEREVGALFVDLVGSTSMALAMPPTEVVRVLNRFFRVVVDAVEAERGMVDKFEGDAALCVFGAPVPSDDPAGGALRSARALAARLARDVPEVDFGIGVSAGVAVAGNVGAERRFEYTVIGDPVNEAARLSELAKQRPERVLASEAALHRAGEAEGDTWNITDSAMLRGRNAVTRLAHPRS
jgi:adenylate cyclase